MQRYFVTKINNLITGSDYHHIKNVMKMRVGDFIIVSDNIKSFQAKIVEISDQIKYQIVSALDEISDFDITIIQGLPKNNKIDTFLKYATCFGASKFMLVEMTRSIAKMTNVENKIIRYQAIIKEAAELSHRNQMPSVHLFSNLKKIDWQQFDIVFLADEAEKVDKLMVNEDLKSQKIAIIIGPEGGIDDQERAYLRPFTKTISLGTNILPTEVAALYILSILRRN